MSLMRASGPVHHIFLHLVAVMHVVKGAIMMFINKHFYFFIHLFIHPLHSVNPFMVNTNHRI
jgi:hypothetical protein